jgi:hypothetical protein
MSKTIPIEILTARRLIREGNCVILEVTVTYPYIPDEESPAVTRFNHTYRAMAEAFLAWSESTPAEEARSAFANMGSAAPYRFDRRVLTCDMTAAEDPRRLTVTRSVTLKSRRGELTERTVTAAENYFVIILKFGEEGFEIVYCRNVCIDKLLTYVHSLKLARAFKTSLVSCERIVQYKFPHYTLSLLTKYVITALIIKENRFYFKRIFGKVL